jgi:CelD/BcsL family acetyltransferase involved in cellulose biosynthesis
MTISESLAVEVNGVQDSRALCSPLKFSQSDQTLAVGLVTEESFAKMAEEWEQLRADSVESSFFLNWQWQYAWWKSFRARRNLFILAFKSGRELVGVLPLFREKKTHWSGLTFLELAFLGTEKVSSDHLSPLCRPGFERAMVQELMNFLDLHCNEWDIVRFRDFADASTFNGMLQAEAKVRDYAVVFDRTEICPYLTLPGCMDEFYESLSGNMRYNLRRRMRQLQKLGFELTIKDGVQDMEPAFHELVRLHTARWHKDSLPGNFTNQNVNMFHHELYRLRSPNWKPVFFFLSDHVQHIAALYAFLHKDTLIYYQAGYDPAWVKYSPGLTLMARVIEFAIEHNLREFDFLRGGENYKWKWTTEYRRTVTYSILKRNIRCGLRVMIEQNLNEAKRWLRGRAMPDLGQNNYNFYSTRPVISSKPS